MTRQIIPVLVALCVWSHVNAEETRTTVALTELSAEGVDPSSVRVIADRIRTELFRTGQFTVVERGQMEEILKEQGFQQSGCTTDACAVEVGQILGVKNIVAGSVGKLGLMFTLNLRMIDVATGRITQTVNVDCKCDIEKVLTGSTADIAKRLALAASSDPVAAQRAMDDAQKKGDGARKHRVWPKVLTGAVAVVAGAAGVFFNSQVSQNVDDMAAVKADYTKYVEQSGSDVRYGEFAAQYNDIYETAQGNALLRNISYGVAALGLVGFGVSFAF